MADKPPPKASTSKEGDGIQDDTKSSVDKEPNPNTQSSKQKAFSQKSDLLSSKSLSPPCSEQTPVEKEAILASKKTCLSDYGVNYAYMLLSSPETSSCGIMDTLSFIDDPIDEQDAVNPSHSYSVHDNTLSNISSLRSDSCTYSLKSRSDGPSNDSKINKSSTFGEAEYLNKSLSEARGGLSSSSLYSEARGGPPSSRSVSEARGGLSSSSTDSESRELNPSQQTTSGIEIPPANEEIPLSDSSSLTRVSQLEADPEEAIIRRFLITDSGNSTADTIDLESGLNRLEAFDQFVEVQSIHSSSPSNPLTVEEETWRDVSGIPTDTPSISTSTKSSSSSTDPPNKPLYKPLQKLLPPVDVVFHSVVDLTKSRKPKSPGDSRQAESALSQEEISPSKSADIERRRTKSPYNLGSDSSFPDELFVVEVIEPTEPSTSRKRMLTKDDTISSTDNELFVLEIHEPSESSMSEKGMFTKDDTTSLPDDGLYVVEVHEPGEASTCEKALLTVKDDTASITSDDGRSTGTGTSDITAVIADVYRPVNPAFLPGELQELRENLEQDVELGEIAAVPPIPWYRNHRVMEVIAGALCVVLIILLISIIW